MTGEGEECVCEVCGWVCEVCDSVDTGVVGMFEHVQWCGCV